MSNDSAQFFCGLRWTRPIFDDGLLLKSWDLGWALISAPCPPANVDLLRRRCSSCHPSPIAISLLPLLRPPSLFSNVPVLFGRPRSSKLEDANARNFVITTRFLALFLMCFSLFNLSELVLSVEFWLPHHIWFNNLPFFADSFISLYCLWYVTWQLLV